MSCDFFAFSTTDFLLFSSFCCVFIATLFPAFLSYLDELIPLIIETLQDQSGAHKRRISLEALGRLVSSTGTAITPYSRYPQLLPTLLLLLRECGTAGAGIGIFSWEFRREILRVMGI